MNLVRRVMPLQGHVEGQGSGLATIRVATIQLHHSFLGTSKRGMPLVFDRLWDIPEPEGPMMAVMLAGWNSALTSISRLSFSLRFALFLTCRGFAVHSRPWLVRPGEDCHQQ